MGHLTAALTALLTVLTVTPASAQALTIGGFEDSCRAEMSKHEVVPEQDQASPLLTDCINAIAPWVLCPVTFRTEQFWQSYDGAVRDIPGMSPALSLPVAATVVFARYGVCTE